MENKPVADKPFVQEFRTLFTRYQGLPSNDVRDVAVTSDGVVWAATGFGLARFPSGSRGDPSGSQRDDGQRWHKVWEAPHFAGANVGRLAAGRDGDLWVGGSTGVSLLRKGKWHHWWGYESPTRWIHSFAPDAQGGVWAVMSHEGDLNWRDVWHLVGDSWETWEVTRDPDPTAIALDGSGKPHLVSNGALLAFDGQQWQPVDLGGEKAIGVSSAPDGSIWVGTEEGVIVLREGKIAQRIAQAEGLPVRGVRRVAFGPDGETWFLHPVAVSRRARDGWHYYSPDAWIPGQAASGLAIGPDGAVWMAGPQGVARIERKTITLAEKARLFEPVVPARHLRDGMVYDQAHSVPDDPESPFLWQVTDNDGSRAAKYMAAECFRYAVSKAPDARTNARACMEGILRLIEVPGLHGFVARSMYRADDEKITAAAGEWHLSKDGKWLWKGDTSSDEMDGDTFGLDIYYDLVATDEERRRIAAVFSKLVHGIVDHDYQFLDADGKHTRWAVWSPTLLRTWEWGEQLKLNSLEILSHLRSAYHITGEERFLKCYRELAEVHGFAEVVDKEQMATPIDAFHKFDDTLAAEAYYPLLTYEDDPALRKIYLGSLERFWEFVKPEANLLYTFLCNALLGRKENLEPAVEVLRGYRMDHANRAIVNEVRQDIEWRQVGSKRLLVKALPGAERAVYQSSRNVYESERRASPGRVGTPVPFLLGYWMARYHGLIE